MRSFVMLIGFLGLLALAGWTCTVAVDETESVIVARFGNPARVLTEPGLHFKWPAPVDSVIRVDKRIRVLDAPIAEFLTADKKNVEVSCFLAWRVAELTRYVTSVRDVGGAEGRLRANLISEVGNIIGEHPLSALVSAEEIDEALLNRMPGPEEPAHTMAQVNHKITQRLGPTVKANFGIEVTCVRIKRLNYPQQNKRAVFSRMEAERQAKAREIRSKGWREAERIRDDAKKEAAFVVSKANREAAELRGKADAEVTRIYAEAFEKDPELYEYLRKLEAYGKLFNEDSTIIIPSDSEILDLLNNPPASAKSGEGQ